MDWFPHRFEGPITRHGVGRDRQIWYNVLFLPADVAADLPLRTHPQLRIEGEIADLSVASAFIPAGDGRHYVIVGPATLRDAGLTVGDRVEMRFRVADQAAVDLPDALAAALRHDAEAETAWAALTPGRQRGLAHTIASARTETTRARRVAAVMAAITGRAPDSAIAADVARLGYLLGRPRAPRR